MRINGLNPSFAYADDAFKRGTLAFDDDSNGYLFCRASGAISAGDVVVIDEDGQAARLSTANDDFGDRLGVAAASLVDSQSGWMQVFGAAEVNVEADCAAHCQLYSTATDGRLDDTDTDAAEIVGIVLTTARDAAAGLSPGFLNWPAVGAEPTDGVV